ncbi:DUF3515 family protein [Amnibacterium endophyticum]|uniref:DUF3515 family protein n=1 Tax=Amnibacterium endophyticum TaxID=2109337 RepID=A0ABW4LID9_9MICO
MRRLALPLAACLLLAGCAPTVSLTPAPQATAVGCASLIVGIRGIETIGDAQRRQTDAQGTAAWGTPASVTLYCGVETPEASALPCTTQSGVDWLLSESGDERIATTYGRAPGVQLITTRDASVNDALETLSGAVATSTRGTDRRCLADPGASATPSAIP